MLIIHKNRDSICFVPKNSLLRPGFFPLPQFSNFVFELKVQNVFSEVFLVQIQKKIRKTRTFEVCIKGKKVLKKRVPNFLTKGKIGILWEKRKKRIFPEKEHAY
jgi:hypothetical protein